MDLKGKKVTVVGLGRSGMAACNLLLGKGAKVSVTDCLDNQKIRENIRALKDKKNIINLELGRHTEDLIKGQDLVVTSPGVPLHSLPIFCARKRGIPVIGEIELAFAFCPCPIIAITGTNGKTTVATLAGQIFKDAGRKCVVCGNIGNPFSAEVNHISDEYVVILEVSSFQLETIVKFKPKVAVVLNLSIDHLDRYTNFNEYLKMKCRIFSNQTKEDWAVLNGADPHKNNLAAKTKTRVLYFGIRKYKHYTTCSKNQDSNNYPQHFNNNHFAALTISSLFGIAEDVAINTCRHFPGIEHRMEKVTEIRQVKFINDSKATNVHSTLWALDVINRPIVLIAGGRDKGSDFTALREKIKNKVRAMVLLGEAKEKIKEAFQDLVLTKEASTLSQAAEAAFYLARPGDCVLLSPMCASFDMFSDYAERGRTFKQAVQSLTQSLKAFKAPACAKASAGRQSSKI